MDCKKYHKTEAISNFIKKNIKREIVLIGEINNENKFFIKEIFKKNKIRNLFIEKINSKKINPSKEYVIIYNHPKWKGNLRLENTLIKNKIIYFKYNTVNLKFKKNNLLSYSLRLSRSLIQKFFDLTSNLIVLIPIKLIFLIGFFIFFKKKNKNYNLKTIKNAYKKIQYKSTKIVAILIHQNQFYQKISKICDDFNELPNQRKKIYLRQITFFSYLNFLNSQIYKSKKNKVPKKILLIKLDHLGDILHSLKSIEIIKKKYKNIKIDIIVGPWGFDLVKKTKLFNNIFIYNPKTKIFDRSLKNNNKRLSMLNEFLFFSKIAKENYDVIFDPSMPRIENIRISMLIPAKIRIGTKYKIDFPYKPWDDKSKIFKKDYESKRIINLIKPILPNKSQPIKDNNIYNIKLTKNQNPDFLKILTKINKFKTIGIAPGSPWKYRKWPELKYVKLINKIIENKYKVVLLGGKEDIQTGLLIEQKINNKSKVLNLIGKTKLDETLKIIQKTKVLICNDGGLFHFSLSLKTPTLVIFGPGDINRWFPKKNKIAKLVYRKTNCNPCSQANCLFKGKCLDKISINKVYNRLNKNFLKNENRI